MKICALIYIAIGTVLLPACGSGGDNVYPEGTVVAVGDDCLGVEEVRGSVPAGLPPEDSIAMAKAYIRHWVDTKLIERVARDEIDMEEIERLTQCYREDLIMSQYRRTMATQATDGLFSEDSLRAYYDSHQKEFVLERPLIKGVYLKVPDDATNLKLLRQLYNSEKQHDMDRLEKAATSSAIHYDYFRNKWIDLEQVETRIPLDFSDADLQGLSRHKPIDLQSQGFVYLLSVNDYLPAGSLMPFEAARLLVRERLLVRKRRLYDTQLRDELYRTALDKGFVVYPGSVN